MNVTVTVPVLGKAGIARPQALLFCMPVHAACQRFGITTLNQVAAFVSQCAHESQNFTRQEENLHYTTPARIRAMWPTRVKTLDDAASLCAKPEKLANRVYAHRGGNGSEASGDGWKYRGRGLIQITFKDGYEAAGKALGQPYAAQPDLLLKPEHGALASAHYFASRGCLALADRGDVVGITRIINGPGLVGLADRQRRFNQALAALSCD